MKRLAVAALLCLVLGSPAHAMSMRLVHTPLAASRNGQAALFLISTLGPEGGGSIEFLLVTPKQQAHFIVSSNFSPGGASRPQTIEESKCRTAVSRLQGALRQAGIVDFAAHPVSSDPRLWAEDRFHVNAEDHARIAAALAQALGLPGTDDAWQQPMPERNARSRWTRMAESWSWYRRHLLDRLWPGSPVEGQCHPKRPRLEAVRLGTPQMVARPGNAPGSTA